jgi:hypothetical protein
MAFSVADLQFPRVSPLKPSAGCELSILKRLKMPARDRSAEILLRIEELPWLEKEKGHLLDGLALG